MLWISVAHLCVPLSPARPEPIVVAEPDSFLPVLDFGAPTPTYLPKRNVPVAPQRRPRQSKKHTIATFLHLEPLEEIREEDDGAILYSPPAKVSEKRAARLWDLGRTSRIFTSPVAALNNAKPAPLQTVPIFSSTSSSPLPSPMNFPLPPNTIPRRPSVEDLLSPLDPDLSFASLISVGSPSSPASTVSSASCYSPLFSSTSERFTPLTPAFSTPAKPALSLQVPSRLDVPAVPVSPITPSSPTAHASIRSQTPTTTHRPCPSPELDPELSGIASSSSSTHSSEVGRLPDSPVDVGEEYEADEFKIIPRLFGSWTWDCTTDEGHGEQFGGEDGLEEPHWNQAIDEVFSLIRTRRPSAQSELGIVAHDIPVPKFEYTQALPVVHEVSEPLAAEAFQMDEAFLRRLSEDEFLLPSRSAPSPPASPRASSSSDGHQRPVVAPLLVQKPEKPKPAPLVQSPFYPPQRVAALSERPLPSQGIPVESPPFSPLFSPTSVSPFMQPVDINSWPAWSAYEPRIDRRPSASALSLMSKFSDDSVDLKMMRKHSSSRRSKLSMSTTVTSPTKSTMGGTSGWFKRNGRISSALSYSTQASSTPSARNVTSPLPTVAPLALNGKRIPRSSTESNVSFSSSSTTSTNSMRSGLKRSPIPLELFIRT